MNVDSLLENPEAGGTRDELAEIVRKNIEDASTILICANHQKRIVDDVLTLSKLEYSMISITPRPTQIPLIINRTLKMFEAETRSHDIEIKINRDPNQGRWVLCDESRLQQILINLLTNAIKFTKAERRKGITVTYGSTITNPRGKFPEGIRWAQNSSNANDLTLNPEWGTGQTVFLTFSITDTGVGMTIDEIKKLFNRFEQASIKTSIKYGGTVSRPHDICPACILKKYTLIFSLGPRVVSLPTPCRSPIRRNRRIIDTFRRQHIRFLHQKSPLESSWSFSIHACDSCNYTPACYLSSFDHPTSRSFGI